MASGTVSVISTLSRQVIDTIRVGTEPFGCALTPDGRDLYVANQSSGTVSVIDTRRDKVTDTIEGAGAKPHGIAITADGKRIFVTQFLALKPDTDPRPLTESEGADDGREGRVTVINNNNHKVIGTVHLTPLADVGAAFRSDGNTAQARAAHRRLQQRVGSVSESARIHHHQGRPGLRPGHLLVAERAVPIQRQRAELPLQHRP